MYNQVSWQCPTHNLNFLCKGGGVLLSTESRSPTIVLYILNIQAPLTLQRETGYNTTSPPCSVCPRPKSHCHVLSDTQDDCWNLPLGICAGIICTWKTFPNCTEGHTAVSAVREKDMYCSFHSDREVASTKCWERRCGPQRAKLYFTFLHTSYCTCVLSVCKFFRMPCFCDFRASYSCPEK